MCVHFTYARVYTLLMHVCTLYLCTCVHCASAYVCIIPMYNVHCTCAVCTCVDYTCARIYNVNVHVCNVPWRTDHVDRYHLLCCTYYHPPPTLSHIYNKKTLKLFVGCYVIVTLIF